jgi:hypothetical protein
VKKANLRAFLEKHITLLLTGRIFREAMRISAMGSPLLRRAVMVPERSTDAMQMAQDFGQGLPGSCLVIGKCVDCAEGFDNGLSLL